MWVPGPVLTHATVLMIDQHSFSATYIAHGLSSVGCKVVGPFDTHAALHDWFVSGGERPSIAIVALDWVDEASDDVLAGLNRKGIPYLLVDNAPWRHFRLFEPTFSWPYASFQVLEALQSTLYQAAEALASATPRQGG